MSESGTSRRRALTGGLAAVAGAFGIDAARRSAGAETSHDALILRSPDIALLGAPSTTLDGRRSGVGRLDGGGHVYVTQTNVDSRFTEGPLERMEQHLFVLDDGQIVGTGSVLADATGSFAVTGGTGRFAAAAGTYTTIYADDAGDGVGAATFTFDLA